MTGREQAVECIDCGRAQIHRACSECLQKGRTPTPVVSFGALRIVAREGRFYEPTWAGEKWAEQLLRQAPACGLVADSSVEGYAVLDGLAENGDIVADWTIPHARAFRWWYRKVGSQVVRDA